MLLQKKNLAKGQECGKVYKTNKKQQKSKTSQKSTLSTS